MKFVLTMYSDEGRVGEASVTIADAHFRAARNTSFKRAIVVTELAPQIEKMFNNEPLEEDEDFLE